MVGAPAGGVGLFGLLGRALLGPPDEGLVKGLCELGVDVQQGEALDDARRDFERLFAIPSTLLIVPTESAYRSRTTDEHGTIRYATTVNPSVVESLGHVYRHFDFVIPERFADRPDHAGVQLAFLDALEDGEQRAHWRGDEAEAARWTSWRGHFTREHCTAWMPDLAEDLERRATTRFYRCVSRALAGALCEDVEAA